MRNIENTVVRLERQCRFYRRLFILAGLVIVTLVSYGAMKPIPDVIRAKRFEAVTVDGVMRFYAGEIEDGQGAFGLGLTNRKGFPVFAAAVSDRDGAQVEIYNDDAKLVVKVGSDMAGHGLISVLDMDGTPRTELRGRSHRRPR